MGGSGGGGALGRRWGGSPKPMSSLWTSRLRRRGCRMVRTWCVICGVCGCEAQI